MRKSSALTRAHFARRRIKKEDDRRRAATRFDEKEFGDRISRCSARASTCIKCSLVLVRRRRGWRRDGASGEGWRTSLGA